MIARPECSEQLPHLAQEAYACGTTGDFRSATKLIQALAHDERPVARAWLIALKAQRWHADPREGTMPHLAACRAFLQEDESARTAAAFAVAEAARCAIILHQAAPLRAWVELEQELTSSVLDLRLIARAGLDRAWLALAEGNPKSAQEESEKAGSSASQHQIAPAVIEATVIRAYSAEALGDAKEAMQLARRAARMSRTEDLPQWQYLSSLALARMRRISGVPHLTARILRPMIQVAPTQWHGWIAWEALMAGSHELGTGIALDESSDPLGEARALQGTIAAAVSGDCDSFGKASSALERVANRWESRARDAEAVLTVLDAKRDMRGVEEDIAAWCLGDEAAPPGAIKGLCFDLATDPGDPGSAAFVVAAPPGHPDYAAPRRIAGLGSRLVSHEVEVTRHRTKSERIPTFVTVLALAGTKGLSRDEVFRVVYGFDFEYELHRGMLSVLLARVREELGDAATLIVEDDNRYRLELNRPLVIPDPRCEQSLEDMVLRALAVIGAQGAKEAAKSLETPLRTIQTALKHLVEEGAVAVQRDGKHVLYVVEDTTFSEPTKWS